MILTMDIETVPSRAGWVIEDVKEKVSPPSNIKKAESIQKWWEEKAPAALDEKHHACGLDAATGEIICIGYGAEDFGAFYGKSEGDIISDFFDLYSRDRVPPTLVGFNHISFDLPFIWRRAKVHGIAIPQGFPVDVKPWDAVSTDVMLMWSGARGRISQDKLCKVFGIGGKVGMSGADVWDYYKAGRLEEIAEYCINDVRICSELYELLR